MEETKPLQKMLFKEIEGRIKLEDESLKFTDIKSMLISIVSAVPLMGCGSESDYSGNYSLNL